MFVCCCESQPFTPGPRKGWLLPALPPVPPQAFKSCCAYQSCAPLPHTDMMAFAAACIGAKWAHPS